jgi:hypothetical protein
MARTQRGQGRKDFNPETRPRLGRRCPQIVACRPTHEKQRIGGRSQVPGPRRSPGMTAAQGHVGSAPWAAAWKNWGRASFPSSRTRSCSRSPFLGIGSLELLCPSSRPIVGGRRRSPWLFDLISSLSEYRWPVVAGLNVARPSSKTRGRAAAFCGAPLADRGPPRPS